MDSHPESAAATPRSSADVDATTLRIDVVSDVVCPWCFIGKRQLESAIARWRGSHPEQPPPVVTWHPFQLNPDMPESGMDREEYLRGKFGRADVSAIYANVRRAAVDVGLTLNLEAVARQPNTLRAHALMRQAEDTGRQSEMAEALFDAYFVSGRDLTDRATLAAIGVAAGLDPVRVDRALDDGDEQRRVADRDAQARGAGVGGVPFFIVNNQIAISGAQGAERLMKAFERATGDKT